MAQKTGMQTLRYRSLRRTSSSFWKQKRNRPGKTGKKKNKTNVESHTANFYISGAEMA